MPDILLTTLNAKYAHAAFGLRYLMANLGELRARAAILEFDIAQRPVDVLEVILAQNPRIVGVGVYIWNVAQATQLVADLRRVRPDVTVVIGGPEVSHETGQQEICRLAHYVVTGEGDLAFAELCRRLLGGSRPLMKVIPAGLPEFAAKQSRSREGSEARRGEESVAPSEGSAATSLSLRAFAPDAFVPPPPPPQTLTLPYDLYTDEDLARRVVYVEASRGCPFQCEFCLSSLDVPVRNAPLDAFLAAMQRLLDRGLRQFKFVDRTFNLNPNVSAAILRFFLERHRPGLFLHFEMIPDRLPDALRGLIAAFPPGALQFEVGIQSFNEDVCARISRRQNLARLQDNLRFLRDRTGVHVHADLIVGLPGETLDSFAAGFDRLVALRPQEIQIGILKRLRGTPIVRHDTRWGMVYSPHPPYEVLQTSDVDFPTLQRLRRFSRYWDLIANSGNFARTAPLIWADGSPFHGFLRLSDWLFVRAGRNHAIALQSLAELLFEYLTREAGRDVAPTAHAIWHDYRQGGRRDGPEFLRAHVSGEDLRAARRVIAPRSGGRRQSRHLGNGTGVGDV